MSFWAKNDDDAVNDAYYEEINSDDDDDDEYVDSSSIEEQIACLKAEYAFQMAKNSQLRMEFDNVNVRMRRRQKILQFYDNYRFDYVFNEDDNKLDMNQLCDPMDIIDIDKDYKSVIFTIQCEERERLEAEEEEEWNMYLLSNNDFRPNSFNNYNKPKHQSSATMVSIYSSSSSLKNEVNRISDIPRGRMRSKSAEHAMNMNILYQVSPDEMLMEKNWMKQLRNKRFEIFVSKYKKQRLIKLKQEYQQKLKEFELKEQKNNLMDKLEVLKKSKIVLIKTTSKEIEQLRNVIDKLKPYCF